MTERNTPPASPWEALRRLLRCNKTQLAERLGVAPRTLHRWEQGEAGADAHRRTAALMQATLDEAHALQHAQVMLNWDNVHKIGGRR